MNMIYSLALSMLVLVTRSGKLDFGPLTISMQTTTTTSESAYLLPSGLVCDLQDTLLLRSIAHMSSDL